MAIIDFRLRGKDSGFCFVFTAQAGIQNKKARNKNYF
jgi:hypothetical protein